MQATKWEKEAKEKIRIKHIMELIPNVSASTASRMKQTCRDALLKKEHQILTVQEFCTYYDLHIVQK